MDMTKRRDCVLHRQQLMKRKTEWTRMFCFGSAQLSQSVSHCLVSEWVCETEKNHLLVNK